MQLEIEKEDTVKFYVASDEKEVKKELQDKFPRRVITLMDDTSRDSLEGMKFAVVDLFCLSKTKKYWVAWHLPIHKLQQKLAVSK